MPEGTVVVLRVTKNDGETLGIYSPNKLFSEWGDLDGAVDHHRGWWISCANFAKCIRMDSGKYFVEKDFLSRGVQLKGLVCNILAHLENGSIFVEFEEDVNGCSADGLGKAGHCVALSKGQIKPWKEPVSKKEKKTQ